MLEKFLRQQSNEIIEFFCSKNDALFWCMSVFVCNCGEKGAGSAAVLCYCMLQLVVLFR